MRENATKTVISDALNVLGKLNYLLQMMMTGKLMENALIASILSGRKKIKMDNILIVMLTQLLALLGLKSSM